LDPQDLNDEKHPTFSFLKSLSHVASDIDDKESENSFVRMYKTSSSKINLQNDNLEDENADWIVRTDPKKPSNDLEDETPNK